MPVVRYNRVMSTTTSDPTPEPGKQSPTDSPWFWLNIFVVGALAALMLTAPKYNWRQPQIERQFQARERSGHAVSAHGGYSPLSTTNNSMLTLRPFFIFFTGALVLLTIVFWGQRIFKMQSRRSADEG